ncbi:MAG: NUDIX hydrolase, partial [Gammaproteobacteria bacterium]|nr:NUDIX hydrolase [Gammaproteobacteria bacterium]
YSRKYGRTILLRNNIMTNPDIFADRKKRFDAVIDACCRNHLSSEGGFNRTLWHEIGHYLGVSKTADGRDLDSALADLSDLYEELKSDLVSLFATPALRRAGYYDDAGMRAVYASGIRRTLQVVRPRAEQPYQNMQLMQFNFYMENGLIGPDPESGLLVINYSRYHDVVTELLRRVLQIQYAGDRARAQAFVERWAYWDDDLHGGLAGRMLGTDAYRRTMVRYKALSGE